MTCAMSIELGAYVLHALEQDEAVAVERHVDGCDQCLGELHELEFTASLLSLLTPGDLEQFERSSTRPYAQGDGVATFRRRHRGILALLAAAVAAATWIAPRAFEQHEPPSRTSVIRAADPTTHVRAAVTVDRQEAGTRLHLSLAGAYPKGWCSLVAHSREGRVDTAATWRADAHGSADVAGMTAIPADHLTELDVVTDTGVVLVTIPMPGDQT